MNLSKKKQLAARTLKVGKKRVVFVKNRLEEVKEAITKQDIRDLHREGAIMIKDVSGRKKKTKRKSRRSTGNIRKKVVRRKKDYVTLTRKLRFYIKELKNKGELSMDEAKELRKKIRNKAFKSKANLKEQIGDLRK
jgi:large subunit ribosomal protein L19e